MQRSLFSDSSRGWMFSIQVPAGLMPNVAADGPLLAVHSHVLSSVCSLGGRGRHRDGRLWCPTRVGCRPPPPKNNSTLEWKEWSDGGGRESGTKAPVRAVHYFCHPRHLEGLAALPTESGCAEFLAWGREKAHSPSRRPSDPLFLGWHSGDGRSCLTQLP